MLEYLAKCLQTLTIKYYAPTPKEALRETVCSLAGQVTTHETQTAALGRQSVFSDPADDLDWEVKHGDSHFNFVEDGSKPK